MLKKRQYLSLAFLAFFTLSSLSFLKIDKVFAARSNFHLPQIITPTYYCGGSNSCITTSPSPTSFLGNGTTNGTTTVSPAPCTHGNEATQSVRNFSHASGNGRGGFFQLLSQLLNILLQLLGFGQSGIPATPAPVGNPLPNPSINPIDTQNVTTTPCPLIVGTANSPVPSLVPAIATSPAPVSSTSAGKTVSPAPEKGGNYAGYTYNDATPVANDTVKATWNAVTTQCSPKGTLSPWVGMGDNPDSETNLAQLGVDIVCTGASPTYKPWTEALPAALIYANDPIKAGDQITASVTYQGSGKFATTMTDKNQGWVINMPMNYASTYAPQGGEAIVEIASDGGGKAPKYTPITFTNFLYSAGNTTQLQGVSAASGIKRFTMTNGATSALTGSTFTVTY
ncbi:MAG: G1 family glutamic endopeptidase [Candidatus Levyibacteriota bacterium]